VGWDEPSKRKEMREENGYYVVARGSEPLGFLYFDVTTVPQVTKKSAYVVYWFAFLSLCQLCCPSLSLTDICGCFFVFVFVQALRSRS